MEELDFILARIIKYSEASLRALDKILAVREGEDKDKLMKEWYKEALKYVRILQGYVRVLIYKELGHEGKVLMRANHEGNYVPLEIPENRIETARKNEEARLQEGVKLRLWPQDSTEYHCIVNTTSRGRGRTHRPWMMDVPPLVSIDRTRSYRNPRVFALSDDCYEMSEVD